MRLPKREQFPTPTPLTAEERALLAFVEQSPRQAEKVLADTRRRSEEPIRIEEIHIEPLPDGGHNGGKMLDTRKLWAPFLISAMMAGNKVPYQTRPASGTPQYQYLDVGVNIDCQSPREVEGQLALTVSADVSNLAPGQTAGNGPLPLLRQNKWSSDVILPLRKPTVLFSSDDPTSTHKMQVELTATPIR